MSRHDASERAVIVFDESGDTGTLAIPESYSTAGIYCGGEHDLELITQLDRDLRSATGRPDYKYKHVARSGEGRTLVASAFREHSTVLVVAIASLSGGVAAEELRFDAAVGADARVEDATAARRSRRDNLDYFTHGVAQGSTGICHSKRQSIDAWWDRRSDMPRIEEAFEQVKGISTRLHDDSSAIPFLRRAAEANKEGASVEFRGACDTRTRPISRVAGVVAADLLRVADSTLSTITPHLRENDELMSLPKAREQYFGHGGILVGEFAEPFGKDSYRLDHMPLFRAYSNRLAAGQFSIWEPGGRILHATRQQGRWYILQVPD